MRTRSNAASAPTKRCSALGWWVAFGVLGSLSACSNGSTSGANPASAGTAGANSGSAGTAGTSNAGASNANAGASNAGSAGVGPRDAGPDVEPKDAAPDAPLDSGIVIPKTAPYQWVGIIGTGQSLAVGGGGSDQQQPISKTPSGKNLKLVDTGADPQYPIAPNTGSPKWAAIPLDEPFRNAVAGTGPGYSDGQYPNNIQGETPQTALGSTLSALFAARGGAGDYVSVHSVVGWAGHCLSDIDKSGGQRAYPASLNETRVFKQLAMTANLTFGVGGIVLTHGECDANTADYATGLYQMWQDYNADLKAITGQTRDVVLLGSQQSTQNSGAKGSAVQLWQASVAHPEQIVCTGPKYQYQYGPDSLHLPATGYVRLGEKYAEIFDIVVNQERMWKPLQPNKITRTGAVVTIAFDVPNPPLVWDSTLAPPHQQMNQQWAAGKGFEVSNQSNQPLTISSVAISGNNVLLTLDKDPGSQAVHVGYALTQDGGGSLGGQVDGLRGLLRDSDDFAGSDAEQIDTQVSNGSAVITSATAGGFTFRTAGDLLGLPGAMTSAVVLSRDSNDQLTLGAPWSGTSGQIKLAYHHGQANFCVHFALDETR